MEKVNNNLAYCTVGEGGKRENAFRFSKESESQAPIKVGYFLMKFVTVVGIETYQWILDFVAAQESAREMPIQGQDVAVLDYQEQSFILLSESCTILFTFQAISSIAWATCLRVVVLFM